MDAMQQDAAMSADSSEMAAIHFVRKYSIPFANENPENELAVAVGQFESRQQIQERKVQRETLEWQRWLQFEDENE